MDIDLSEDLQYYKESFVLGLTVKQAIFSFLALGVGTGIVLLLYKKIGITLSCYVATPFVVPLALTGFYNYHGLTSGSLRQGCFIIVSLTVHWFTVPRSPWKD